MATVTYDDKTVEQKQDRVRFLIRCIAAHLSPRMGSLINVAQELNISRQHLNRFMVEGHMPVHMARRLNKLYGDTLAPIEELSWKKI